MKQKDGRIDACSIPGDWRRRRGSTALVEGVSAAAPFHPSRRRHDAHRSVEEGDAWYDLSAPPPGRPSGEHGIYGRSKPENAICRFLGIAHHESGPASRGRRHLGVWLFARSHFMKRLGETARRTAEITVRYMKAQELLSTAATQIRLGSIDLRDTLLALGSETRRFWIQGFLFRTP